MPLILASNSASGGYNVANSLRFNVGSSDYLEKTNTGAGNGNLQIWTFSCWVKRSVLGTVQTIFSFGADSSSEGQLYFDADDFLVLLNDGQNGSSNETDMKFRDVGAWYHIIWACDSTQATNANRWKVYVNGTQVTLTGSPTITLNGNGFINAWDNFDCWIGANARSQQSGNAPRYLGGYTSEVYFIDGQQLTPSSFGQTDPSVPSSGIWQPKAYTGSYGTNGFYLKFANSAALGTDSSGNGNTFTVNNLTSVDQSKDTPTNNFATMNPLRQPTGNPATLTNGNLTVATNTSAGYYGGRSTISVSSGKWYFEAKLVSYDTITGGIGIQNAESYTPEMFSGGQGAFAGYSSTGWTYYTSGPYTNNNTDTSYGNSFDIGDIISVALDCDNAKLYFGKNGTWQNSGVPTSGATGTGAISITSGLTYLFAVDDTGSTRYCVWDCNFGSPPFTISSGNTDAEGFGNFEYAVPSGYFALCTKNLATYG
jgi:hypothetical protein